MNKVGNPFLSLVLILAVSMVFQSCGKEIARRSDNPLAGTAWRLVEIQSMDDAVGSVRPDRPSNYTMQLNDDSTVTMRLNCNRANGNWSAKPSEDGESGNFRFGPLAMTRALCPPPSLDERIAKDAEYVRSYLFNNGKLYLSLMADGGIYVWEPDSVDASAEFNPAAPEDGGPRNWEFTGPAPDLTLREQPSESASLIGTYPLGTIFDNLGCERIDGRVWCDVQPLGGGSRGWVPLDLLKPAVSPDGSVATGPDDSAVRAGQRDFDATGRIPCALSEGQPMGSCEFGVARAGGGYATVVITRPDGTTRAVFFRMGIPIGADVSQADGYPEFHASKESDLHFIRVGDERYEIPDAVIFGG